MMCNCAGMARTFDNEDRSLPLSKHHPMCEDYKLITYANVSYGGSDGLIMEHSMIDEYLKDEVQNGSDINDFAVTDIQMTEDQYESLPEHGGF